MKNIINFIKQLGLTQYFLENIIKCDYKEISEEYSRIIKKRVYLDKRFESFFLQFIKKLYFIL